MNIQVDFPYCITRAEWREFNRLKAQVRRDAKRKADKLARKAYWSQAYWARTLRFETFKVGGLRFIKLGSLSISVCLTVPKEVAQ